MVATKEDHELPRGKKFTAEQIIGKLLEAEVGLAQGKTVPEVVRKLSVTEQIDYRWKREDGGQQTDQSKGLRDLEKESARLKRLLADPEPDKAMLRKWPGRVGVKTLSFEPGSPWEHGSAESFNGKLRASSWPARCSTPCPRPRC